MSTSTPPELFLAARIRKGRYFFLGPVDSRRGFHVVAAGWEECEPDFAIRRRSFPYHAVELLAGGTWNVGLDGKSRRVGAGAVVAYGPDCECSLAAAGAGPHIKYFLDLQGARVRSLLRDCGLGRRRIFQPGGAHWLQNLCEQIISCSELPEEAAGELAAGLSRALLMRIGAATSASSMQDGERNAFRRCREHLETHYTSPGGIAEAAAACHVSAEHFSRMFRRFTGTTAANFLFTLRMNHAARLLGQSDMTVKGVAAEVGFQDPYHFSKAFKRHTGRSPVDFRSH